MEHTGSWMDKPSLSKDESIVPNAFLVSTYEGPKNAQQCEEHVQELALLADTFGATVVGKVTCHLRKHEASTFVTSGKLQELVAEAKALNANLVVFDDEITPSQQRNLEEAFGITVMDRTELILEVFSRHARTREAQIQIELAKVKYQYPRLKRLWTHLERQSATGGTGGYLKGAGEKQIELDKRMLQTRVIKLEQDLEEMIKNRNVQRHARQRANIPQFAIIGYTNVGKSTLLNALTDAGVLAENKLFATLDTTTRRFNLPNHQEILLIDTVGFIRKLPHQLVASFRSTLEESLDADILLHIIDVSHPQAFEQAQATQEVLKELGAEARPMLTVLNKIDACTDQNIITRLRLTYPKTIQVSALNREGFETLIEKMTEEISKLRQVVKMRIPQSDFGVVTVITQHGAVIHQEYEENDVLMEVEISHELAGKYRKYIISEQAE